MRKDNARQKGARAAKQGAILFLCAIVCAASIYGIWKITFGAERTETEKAGLPTPEITDHVTEPPTEKPAASPEATIEVELPEETVLPETEHSAAATTEPTESVTPTPELTQIPLRSTMAEPDHQTESSAQEVPIVMADPLEERIRIPINGAIGNGEMIELPLSGLVIGIDPGHQAHGNSDQEPVAPGSSETKAKVSSGTQGVASGVPEYEVNLDVSLMLRDVLVSYGAEVHMARTTNNVDISNIERALMFNEANADLVLRIHCNGSSNSGAEGIGLYVTKTGPIAEESYAIAEVVLNAMVSETGADKDGVFRRDTYSGLNWSEVPSMIVEMGFMSNPQEDMKLQDPEYRQKLVTGMVKGIAQYYGRDLEE